jgi:hypothetical protein
MRSIKTPGWFVALGLGGALVLTARAQDTPALILGDVWSTQPSSFTGTKGWQFGIGPLGLTNTIAITQLGVFDEGGDGLVNSHQIGLWRNNGTLLASATVPAGTEAQLVGGYRYVPITPVVIPFTGQFPGFFVIAAHYSAGDADDMVTPTPYDPVTGGRMFNIGVAPVFLYGRFGLGPGLPFPSDVTQPPFEGGVAEKFWEPNFQYAVIPEPSVWLLFSLGAFGFLLGCRKLHRTRTQPRESSLL